MNDGSLDDKEKTKLQKAINRQNLVNSIINELQEKASEEKAAEVKKPEPKAEPKVEPKKAEPKAEPKKPEVKKSAPKKSTTKKNKRPDIHEILPWEEIREMSLDIQNNLNHVLNIKRNRNKSPFYQDMFKDHMKEYGINENTSKKQIEKIIRKKWEDAYLRSWEAKQRNPKRYD